MGTWWDPHDNIVRCPRKCPWHVYPPRTMVFYTIMIVLPPRIVAKYYFMHVHGMTAEVLCGCGDDREKQLQQQGQQGQYSNVWQHVVHCHHKYSWGVHPPRTKFYLAIRRVLTPRIVALWNNIQVWGDCSAVLCVWWWRGYYSNWGDGITILTWANLY